MGILQMAVVSDVDLGIKLDFYYSKIVCTQSWVHRTGILMVPACSNA